MVSVLEAIGFYIGLILAIIGAILDLIGAIGLIRFPNFFVRLHAATVASIGGAAYPLMGVGLMILCSNIFTPPIKYFVAGASISTGILTFIAASTGSHVLARAAHRSGVPVKPKVCDFLEIDKKHQEGGKE